MLRSDADDFVFKFYMFMELKSLASNYNCMHGIGKIKWLHTAYIDLAPHDRVQLMHSILAVRLDSSNCRFRTIDTDMQLHPILNTSMK